MHLRKLELFRLKLIFPTKFEIQELQWSESSGSGAEDGFTSELVAVKGKANVSGRSEEFSFMVKSTPEIAGQRLDMVMEVQQAPGQSAPTILVLKIWVGFSL